MMGILVGSSRRPAGGNQAADSQPGGSLLFQRRGKLITEPEDGFLTDRYAWHIHHRDSTNPGILTPKAVKGPLNARMNSGTSLVTTAASLDIHNPGQCTAWTESHEGG